jgi:hypothetical protein
MIVDLVGVKVNTFYWENWGDSTMLEGWIDDGDIQL